MQKIKYTFADGTTSEIEVTDELYALHLEIAQQERRLYWRESRRQEVIQSGAARTGSRGRYAEQVNYGEEEKATAFNRIRKN